MTRESLIRGAVVAVLLGCAPASHAFTPWANANGTALSFSYANGGSDNGLYGDPSVVGNTFLFAPNGFQAVSTDGVASTVTDRVSVDLFANAGFAFTQIIIQEIGDYQIETDGEVSVTGELQVDDLNSSASFSDTLATNPSFPVSGATGGNVAWNGVMALDLTGQNLSEITLSFENGLFALSAPGSTAQIRKNLGTTAVAVTIVPAPSAVALLGVAALARRRRR